MHNGFFSGVVICEVEFLSRLTYFRRSSPYTVYSEKVFWLFQIEGNFFSCNTILWYCYCYNDVFLQSHPPGALAQNVARNQGSFTWTPALVTPQYGEGERSFFDAPAPWELGNLQHFWTGDGHDMAGNCHCHDTPKKQWGKAMAECEVIALHLENVFMCTRYLMGPTQRRLQESNVLKLNSSHPPLSHISVNRPGR